MPRTRATGGRSGHYSTPTVSGRDDSPNSSATGDDANLPAASRPYRQPYQEASGIRYGLAGIRTPSVDVMTVPPVPASASPGRTGERSTTLTRIGRRLRADTAYVLSGLPVTLAAFVVSVTGFSLGVGLLVIVAGFPVLTGTILALRGFATLERIRVGSVLSAPARLPRYRRARPGAGWFRRICAPLADPQSWLDLLHPILALPVTIVTWSVTVTWWTGALSGITYAGWYWALPNGPDNHDLPELLGLSDSDQTRVFFYTGLGIVFLATLVPVTRGCALVQTYLAKIMLSGIAEIQATVADLRTEREHADARTATARAQTAAAVAAETTALRRLERDIHDGPQQRLVRLAMDLGRAKHQLDSDDSAAARATVDEAIAQTRETLDELRALSRGIAPPILVDRGLGAAITALAGRGTIPVDLDMDEMDRLPAAVESTAYFVIAESLTNIAKHSQATACQISVRRAPDAILIRVRDNGIGGAHISKGHGLSGLADRVSAADGSLSVRSPHADDEISSGTVVAVRLPL